jgi:hypothetical protein
LHLLEMERTKCASMEKNLLNSSKNESVRRITRDAGVQKTVLTRDIGVTHIAPRTRY